MCHCRVQTAGRVAPAPPSWGGTSQLFCVEAGTGAFSPVQCKYKNLEINLKKNLSLHPRGEYFYLTGNAHSRLIFSPCRNIQIRVFCAKIFKLGCFVQKYWSVTVTRYTVTRGWIGLEKSNSNGLLNHGREGQKFDICCSADSVSFLLKFCTHKNAFLRSVQKYY